ncbi:MAG: carbohydrate kinase family protein [Actinobacteria bacterium]|nr:carbohydrate kinase family protein [Actinomycetota bacterium]
MTWITRWLRAGAEERPRLLVVGGASLDVIHVDGQRVSTPGGAGLYTALAAARAGADVTMLAPVPHPMPPELAPACERIRWVGPAVPVDALPRFEIAYDASGAVTLFHEYLGAEPDMAPALLDGIGPLPGCAYCVPFLDARLQQSFIAALRERGCLTVAATYGKAAREETTTVRETAAMADMFFCNDDEASVLFGGVLEAGTTVGSFRFVTRGASGASVFQGDHRTDLAGVATIAVDPTGAGDTFCGTTVARILIGDHPVESARRGTAAAAQMVTAVGPAALWSTEPSPYVPADPRATPDTVAIDRLSALLRSMPSLDGFAFAGELFPAVGDPSTVSWFTAATLQQYGFWYEVDGHHGGPMIAPIEGVERKGSDYLWAQYLRWSHVDPAAMTPERQAGLDVATWSVAARSDTGTDPYPDPAMRVRLAHDYGATMGALGLSPEQLVTAAAASERPMASLLRLLDHVGGYREDPLRKKAALLGVILRQRPESFLPEAAHDDAPPIVDYHVQRTSLRTGIVAVPDPALRASLSHRRVLAADDEDAVRRATFEAVGQLAARSGRDMGAVDWFLFQMRHQCPEMSEPQCAECPADSACAKSTGLFQPVFRTTAY